MKLYILLFLFLISCSPKVKDNPEYEVDVKPIIKSKCAQCHNDKWLNINTFNTNIKLIQEMVIKQRKMPPNQLSAYEYETIKKYIDNRLKVK